MNKTDSAGQPTIIRLTRIQKWFVPVDADSYLTLRKAGVALTRIPVDFLPALKLLTAKHKIRGVEVNFKDKILNPFLDAIGTAWKENKSCDCTIAAKAMTFECKKTDGLDEARKAVPKLRDDLAAFFARWGYRHTFEYSEARGKCQISIDYWFDPERQPIVILDDHPAESQEKISLTLGTLRLTFAFDPYESKIQLLRSGGADSMPPKKYKIGYVHTTIEIAQGGKFVPMHTSRCTYDEISSVKPLIVALMGVPNRSPENLDKEPE